MTILTENTDAGNTAATTYSMAVGDYFSGTLEPQSDSDWIAVTLRVGGIYTFAQVGVGALGTRLNEPYLRLRDSDGMVVSPDNGDDSKSKSTFTYTAISGGTYYLDAQSVNAGQSGSYVLSMAAGYRIDDDVMIGGDGDMIGGDGDDSFTGSNVGDFLYGGAGNDSIIGGEGSDFIGGGDGADIIYTGKSNKGTTRLDGIDTVYGGAGDDSITGSNFEDLLNGDAGNDTLSGGYDWASADTDTLNGGAGNDLLISGQGEVLEGYQTFGDVLNGGAGHDTLEGGQADDTLDGGDGNDSLIGGEGSDLIRGGAGADIIHTGKPNNDTTRLDGIDTAHGGAGDDSITGSNRGDWLNGDAGNDTLSGGYDWASADTDTLNGGAGNDLLMSGQGEVLEAFQARGDVLDGGADNDTLVGGQADDTLGGGSGNDQITGNGGNDLFKFIDDYGIDTISDFDATNDLEKIDLSGVPSIENYADLRDNHLSEDATDNAVITAGRSTVTLTGVAMTDLQNNDFIFSMGEDLMITGTAGADNYAGGTGNDSLDGGAGNDSIDGGTGNDSLVGGAGDDNLDGGTGTDVASYASASAGVTVNLATTIAQATGGAGTDSLTNIEGLDGSAFDDALMGDGTDNRLAGNDGDDTLEGGDGDDTLEGGDGTDVAFYTSAIAGVTVNLATTIAQATGGAGSDILTGIEQLAGSDHDDMLTGDGTDNHLAGNGGNDTLEGGDGDDTLEGNDGNDTLEGGDGDDTLEGGAGNDSIDGGGGTDVASYANAGAAVTVNLANAGGGQATGGAGTDTLVNIDVIEGSAYGDTIVDNQPVGPRGTVYRNDTIYGGAGNDTIDGGWGRDLIYGGAGNDSIDGGRFVNTIHGGTGNDTITGGSEYDELHGNSGDNILNGGISGGGHGNDVLTGGTGIDTFVLENRFGNAESILDFEVGKDKIDLSGVDTITDFNDLMMNHLTSKADGNNIGSAYIQDHVIPAAGTQASSTGSAATLVGVDMNALTASDFIF